MSGATLQFQPILTQPVGYSLEDVALFPARANPVTPRIVVTTPSTFASEVVDHFLSCLPKDELPCVGLPTGGTQEPVYAELIRRRENGELKDFQDPAWWMTFNLDEYLGLSSDQAAKSYRSFMDENLFRSINSDFAFNLFPGIDNVYQYDQWIKEAGGLDVWMGGIGVLEKSIEEGKEIKNGAHLAFSESGTPFDSLSGIVTLSETTRRQNARFFDGNIDEVPYFAYTMGLGTILRLSRNAIVNATGLHKVDAVEAACFDEPTILCSASVLQYHQSATLFVCEEIGNELIRRGHKLAA